MVRARGLSADVVFDHVRAVGFVHDTAEPPAFEEVVEHLLDRDPRTFRIVCTQTQQDVALFHFVFAGLIRFLKNNTLFPFAAYCLIAGPIFYLLVR